MNLFDLALWLFLRVSYFSVPSISVMKHTKISSTYSKQDQQIRATVISQFDHWDKNKDWFKTIPAAKENKNVWLNIAEFLQSLMKCLLVWHPDLSHTRQELFTQLNIFESLKTRKVAKRIKCSLLFLLSRIFIRYKTLRLLEEWRFVNVATKFSF